MTVDSWADVISEYRQEEPIATILQQINRPSFVVDPTIQTELRGYYVFIQKSEMKPRSIAGPADYGTALQILEEVNVYKDRVSEITLKTHAIFKDLERLWEIAKVHILLKPEVASAKSDTIRYAVISKTVHEVEEAMKNIKSQLSSAELLTKNLNQTYNITHTQVEVVKQIVYWRSLSLPTDEKSTREVLHTQA